MLEPSLNRPKEQWAMVGDPRLQFWELWNETSNVREGDYWLTGRVISIPMTNGADRRLRRCCTRKFTMTRSFSPSSFRSLSSLTASRRFSLSSGVRSGWSEMSVPRRRWLRDRMRRAVVEESETAFNGRGRPSGGLAPRWSSCNMVTDSPSVVMRRWRTFLISLQSDSRRVLDRSETLSGMLNNTMFRERSGCTRVGWLFVRMFPCECSA